MNAKSLVPLSPPRDLSDRLKVLASREALRQRRRVTIEAFLEHIWDETRLRFSNMMKPYALPVTGGLISTFVLFGVLAPSLAVDSNVKGDVPTALSTPAALQSAFFMNLAEGGEFVVDVSIDEQGRVIGYTIPRGQKGSADPELVRSLEAVLLGTRFIPATLFGQPANGRTRITLQRSSVIVPG